MKNGAAVFCILFGFIARFTFGEDAGGRAFIANDSLLSSDEAVISRGKTLSKQLCSSCHYLEGTSTGPTLGGITTVRDLKWLYEFVRNPMAMVENGDPQARALLEKYKLPMPAFTHLKDADLFAIFSHIHSYSKKRGLSYKPEGNSGHLKALMTLPSEPIQKIGITIKLSEVATLPKVNFERPSIRLANMRSRPGDTPDAFYLNDHDGYIYRIQSGSVDTVFEITQRFPNFIRFPGLATGLGSFAFHPEFTSNGLLYVSHTEKYAGRSADYEYSPDIDTPIQWILSEVKLEKPQDPFNQGTWRELMRINVPDTVHGMQDIKFSRLARPGDSDYGLLFIGFGDGGATNSGNPNLCHNLQSPLGTIMRIDPLGANSRNGRYGIPSDNPFVQDPNTNTWKEIYAYGFRNPHRLAWDHLNNGRLIASEISHRLFEEINVIQPGKDYGWNIRDANILYQPRIQKYGAAIPWEITEEGFEKPFAVYSHLEGNAISGGFVYRGSAEELQGKYIFGDIVSGRIFCLDLDLETKGLQTVFELDITNETNEPGTLREWVGRRRADLRFGEDQAGELYIMTKADGKIRKIISAKRQ